MAPQDQNYKSCRWDSALEPSPCSQTQPKLAATTSQPGRELPRFLEATTSLIPPLPSGAGSLPQHLAHSHPCHKIAQEAKLRDICLAGQQPCPLKEASLRCRYLV